MYDTIKLAETNVQMTSETFCFIQVIVILETIITIWGKEGVGL